MFRKKCQAMNYGVKCPYKVFQKGDKFCDQHQCQHLGCQCKNIGKFKYCSGHVNEHVKTNCGCTIDHRGEFRNSRCTKHKCKTVACTFRPVEGSLYCQRHKCRRCSQPHTVSEGNLSYCQPCYLKILLARDQVVGVLEANVKDSNKKSSDKKTKKTIAKKQIDKKPPKKSSFKAKEKKPSNKAKEKKPSNKAKEKKPSQTKKETPPQEPLIDFGDMIDL